MKKQLIAAGIATAVGVTGLSGTMVANAATDTTSTTNPMSSIVDAIASKFNLDKAQVQSVFDEQRTKMETEREAKVVEEIKQLVTNGKLTQAQADAINEKRAELKEEREANRESMQSKTSEEMKTEMETKRTELEAWAKEKGIDTEYLRYVFGGHHGGPGGPGGRGKSDDSSTSEDS